MARAWDSRGSGGTIPELLRGAAATHGHRAAIEDGGRRLSFDALLDQALRCAGGLRRLGIVRGDRVAIWAPNRWEWVAAALGIHEVGAVLVPVNTRYKGPEARYLFENSAAKLVFTVESFLGLELAAMVAPASLPVVLLDRDWESFLGEPVDAAAARPDDPSDLLFTSGTTGRPKGVVTTHAQSLRTYATWAEIVGLEAGDRYLVVPPFFHCFGYKAGWLACLLTGATVLPQAVFDVDQVLARIPVDRVSVLPGPPALYQSLLARDRSGFDLSSLRLAVTGAASIPVQLVRRMRDELGFETVLTAYGLTECTGVATMCRQGDDAELVASTSGRAIPGVEVRVVGASGAEVPRGEAGEVWVRGFNVMIGYHDDPAATAEAVVDGWLRTGDVGVMDADGYLRITDRLKDMFIVGGFNAYPAEIESILLGHEGILEVAVVGVPDERLGEVGVAYVVGRGELDGAALVAWARERMANFKVPRRFVFVASLPRNASAKVLKTELRRLAEAGSDHG